MTFSKLGIDIDSNQLVNLPKAARTKGLYIIGLQGMGKSGLLENLIMEDINQQIGVCVLDPKRELIDNIIARLPNKQKEEQVIYLDLAEKDYFFGLNLFDCSDPTDDDEITKTVNQVTHVFEKAFGISMDATPRIYDYLFNIAYTLIANPGYTMIDIPLVFNPACRQKLLGNVPSGDVVKFWDDIKQLPQQEQHSQAREILRRLNDLSHFPLRFIVGQSRSTIDLQKVMDERKILLVKLDRTKEQATSLIGSIIVALILKASASRQTKRPQFHLYADEFQRFATEDFATLLEEARYADIGVTMAHQNRSQLELSNKQADANLKTRTLNVGNIVVFRVPTDASELAEHFDTTPPPAREEDIEIIDGEEEIKTPVGNTIEWLQSAKTHPHPRVNQFMMKHWPYRNTYWLGSIDLLTLWNAFFYQVMRENNPMLPIPLDLLKSQLVWSSSPDLNGEKYQYLTQPWYFPLLHFSTFYVSGQQMFADHQYILENVSLSLNIPQTFYVLAPIFERHVELYKRRLFYLGWSGNEIQVQQTVKKFEDERQTSEQFLIDLREVMAILAVAPILEGSGIRRPRKRIQHIVHAQQSRADREMEIAGHLLHLQKFTAWVKIAENIPQNPGKKCLKCRALNRYGANNCRGCGTQLPAPNEYIITTLQPPKGMQQLDQRIKRIQTNNLHDGYVKKRADVEAEILQRQTSCSGGSAPAQPKQPLPQPQPRHARQVPVQGKCPNCGKNNPSGSKFCNQCGTKL